ncbi:hypothetical protein KC722_01305 [Candidatus Kaiserbacteria bacterium]|nr:hypothetical protein [Candidatus Kaiserbacteria bacterium]MCB9811985.1 hypothetical protein [Candidatus Nomurabacteria bacterium]
MKESQLFALLEEGRKNNNIYLVARAALLLRGIGVPNCLTADEKNLILYRLQCAREGKGTLGLEPGYELARWILICRYIFPEKYIVPSLDDIRMIQEACDSYCKDRILKQVASLVHMQGLLNIPLSINRLPPKKRKYVMKLAAALK